MSYLPPAPRQGLRTFGSFGDYLKNWIRPNLLGDLETVFSGASDYWARKQIDAGGLLRDGRGDFILAMVLFSVFDHLGSFIAWSAEGPQSHQENIARVARCLPSTRDIYALIANLGRNSLVHGAWPQTGVSVEDGSWGVGMAISAGTPPDEHNLLHTRNYDGLLPQDPRRVITVVKVTLNVHALLHELREWVAHGEEIRGVRKEVFRRVQSESPSGGLPMREQDNFASDRHRRSPTYLLQRLCFPDTFEEQAIHLQAQAVSLNIWGREGVRVKRPIAAGHAGGFFKHVRDAIEKKKRNSYFR